MPRKDGREALREIKADAQLRRIPVVVLTTSTVEDDIAFSYDMGVNSYIAKPTTFRRWVEIIKTLSKYWFEVVELPSGDSLPRSRTASARNNPRNSIFFDSLITWTKNV